MCYLIHSLAFGQGWIPEPLFLFYWCASCAVSRVLASHDISIAADQVCHDVLSPKLVRLGLPPAFVAVLEHSYGTTTYQAQLPGGLTHAIPVVHGGLKQGCPLSPTLFNLYVLHLPALLRQRCPGSGITCGGAFTPALQMFIYADDMALLGATQRDLSLLIHEIERMLADLGLSL